MEYRLRCRGVHGPLDAFRIAQVDPAALVRQVHGGQLLRAMGADKPAQAGDQDAHLTSFRSRSACMTAILPGSAMLDPAGKAGQNTGATSGKPARTPSKVKTAFATIVSPNYLAYARVLGDSLACHAPEAQFHVLVVTRPDAAVAAAVGATGLQATYATDLGLADF